MCSKCNVLGPKKGKQKEDRVKTRSRPKKYTTQPTMRTCLNAPLSSAHADTACTPPTTLLLSHHALKRFLPFFPHQQGRQGPKKKERKFFGRRKTNSYSNRSLFLDITIKINYIVKNYHFLVYFSTNCFVLYLQQPLIRFQSQTKSKSSSRHFFHI
jgi:hypothetical protein